MEAVQRQHSRQFLVRALVVMAVTAALILAGTVGYWIKSSTLSTTAAVTGAHAPAAHAIGAPQQPLAFGENQSGARHLTTGSTRGLNSDSAAGYAARSGVTATGVGRGLNGDSAAGYTAGSGVTTTGVGRGLNGDSASGYAGGR